MHGVLATVQARIAGAMQGLAEMRLVETSPHAPDHAALQQVETLLRLALQRLGERSADNALPLAAPRVLMENVTLGRTAGSSPEVAFTLSLHDPVLEREPRELLRGTKNPTRHASRRRFS